jgi:branched-chain amino acid transport system ATP-binding protein
MADLLRVSALVAGYGPVRILHQVELCVAPSQRWAVLGRNGVGKTTLLKAIMGLADVAQGAIQWDGQDITGWTTRQRAMAGLGYVPQTRDIFPSLSVAENLVAGLKGRPRKCIDEAYELFPRLAQRRDNAGTQLSGGEQQRTAVARALAAEPALLLADEPSGNLDLKNAERLHDLFAELAQDLSLGLVVVTHNQSLAARADRALLLEGGRLVETNGLGLES